MKPKPQLKMKNKKKPKVPKNFAGKLWYFLWEDDSIWSWIVTVALAFIVIKFIVYPVLGFVLSTSHPIVAVVSGSMEHDGSFDSWWNSEAECNGQLCKQKDHYALQNISKEKFRDFHFRNGFNKGDIIVLYGKEPEDIDVGEVIVFNSNQAYPIIHRVISKTKINNRYYFETKGDHNPGPGDVDKDISEDRIIGKALFRIPYVGWLKIGLFDLLGLNPRNNPNGS
jgi:signal peptidase I